MTVGTKQTRRGRHVAPGLFLLALLLGGCDPPPAPQAATDTYGNVIGPVHSPATLASHALLGVKLHMPSPQAEAALVTRGLSMIVRDENQVERERTAPLRQRRFWISRAPETDAYRFPEYITLTYVQAPDGGWIVASIAHHQRITASERNDAPGTRAMLVQRFGTPSLWKQEVYRGELWDEMDFVSAPALQNRDRMDRVRACHVDWRCEMVLRKNDCRDTMRNGRGLALKISFPGGGGNRILYELEDFGLLTSAEETNERFRKLDVRGAFCEVPAPGGELPIVVTVPE